MLLYIHIPYCDSKCHYCSFNSFTDRSQSKRDYMKALKTQLHHELQSIPKNSITSLFIGGGTPSTIEPQLYTPIFTMLQNYLHQDCEITIEANPNSASIDWLKGMKALGINRISFGVQSFNAAKLKTLNRSHTPQIAKEAINNAHKVGFENISLDLIYNVAGDTKALLLNDINEAFALPINHISAYELTIEENTLFEKTPQMRVEDLEIAHLIRDTITQRGFVQYEVSNYGSYQSRHNLGYWQLQEYIGVGAGAVGFRDSKRLYPHNNLDAYIANPLYKTIEALSKEELQLEKIFLGLRSKVGIHQKILTPDMQKRANFLVEEKKLIFKNDTYYNLDFLLSDEIALYIT
ncbi:MAG: coproporphyrinogen III oxidase family protein [Campylobacterales bacterium]|nr:coproporphyrinogen III oxidase family protein [Campylobacterales bacterium]